MSQRTDRYCRRFLGGEQRAMAAACVPEPFAAPGRRRTGATGYSSGDWYAALHPVTPRARAAKPTLILLAAP